MGVDSVVEFIRLKELYVFYFLKDRSLQRFFELQALYVFRLMAFENFSIKYYGDN